MKDGAGYSCFLVGQCYFPSSDDVMSVNRTCTVDGQKTKLLHTMVHSRAGDRLRPQPGTNSDSQMMQYWSSPKRNGSEKRKGEKKGKQDRILGEPDGDEQMINVWYLIVSIVIIIVTILVIIISSSIIVIFIIIIRKKCPSSFSD